MKKLLLVRHGKAKDDSPTGDFGRELKHSGIADVEQLAEQLNIQSLQPQIIITSDAARAKATAKIITLRMGVDNIIEDNDIYEAGDGILLQLVNSLDNRYEFAMLVGHNPGFSSIATYLSAKYVSLNTSGAVLLQFDVDDWQQVSGGTGTIEWQSQY